MKIKVNFFDIKLIKNYLEALSIIALIFSFALIAIIIPDDSTSRIWIGIGLLLILLIVYLIMWMMANNQSKAALVINNSDLIMKTGNIFEEDGLKVIAFNEYFDTLVDNRIISENSLNGAYIKQKVKDIKKLDHLMDIDSHLSENVIDINDSRTSGKKKKYKLGTVFQNDDYLLTAFTKFDTANRACLNMNEFVNFLLNFWNEIDMIYAGRSVVIPLLGSGITRLKEYNTITEQELLELLIWSFRLSRIKFTYPSKVSVIIHESKKDKINFYGLKEN
ncbi:hypothetical protein AU468_09535 [Alkalispirochaeta sphaeroplastigenens]|uniref:Thoeris protein ThsA Macro domain-containing protein n=1 Tax=Alkalispirochaeta sphaeroplastigenens TaxID=1187066 RepID=A0A2S4JM32_9SPIO|nr:macro domain-containing protein [Alkalispirochaeta sphaeroplastigenens]POR00578.1 hypothetical protein AU468_09535 [Alkalispirochaeta sphaeroplastigenens]